MAKTTTSALVATAPSLALGVEPSAQLATPTNVSFSGNRLGQPALQAFQSLLTGANELCGEIATALQGHPSPRFPAGLGTDRGIERRIVQNLKASLTPIVDDLSNFVGMAAVDGVTLDKAQELAGRVLPILSLADDPKAVGIIQRLASGSDPNTTAADLWSSLRSFFF